jgi:hypothetical protein
MAGSRGGIWRRPMQMTPQAFSVNGCPSTTRFPLNLTGTTDIFVCVTLASMTSLYAGVGCAGKIALNIFQFFLEFQHEVHFFASTPD